jgi:hypothetical protein
LMAASNHYRFAKFPTANADLEAYIHANPTKKIVLWNGNPHLARFWFDWYYCPITETREEVDYFWTTYEGRKLNKNVPSEISDPNNRPYLNRDDLSRVCDMIVVYNANMDRLKIYDERIRRLAPGVVVKDFYHGVIRSLPLMADETGVLSVQSTFSTSSRLPLIRLYDLRGTSTAN